VLDIGANIGVTAVILAETSDLEQLYAFEPAEETFQFLQETIAANQLTHCQTFCLALGDHEGDAEFYASPLSSSVSHLGQKGVSLGGSNAKVQMKTLDRIVAELGIKRVDLIKIDVEGFELDVLAGASDTLARFHPAVFLEFNSFTLIAYGNHNPRWVLEQLKRTFPHVYRFTNGIPVEITDGDSVLGFIHENLTAHGCVDDLLCSFAPIALDGRRQKP
jgi:FkbM family methyltransferase